MLNDYENCVLDELMLEIKNDVLAQPQDNEFYCRHRYCAYRNDVLAQPQDNDYSRRHRCGAYRQYILWVHGQLGAGNRRGILAYQGEVLLYVRSVSWFPWRKTWLINSYKL